MQENYRGMRAFKLRFKQVTHQFGLMILAWKVNRSGFRSGSQKGQRE
jgi:hypothetical protein